jgi:hypothetical protein
VQDDAFRKVAPPLTSRVTALAFLTVGQTRPRDGAGLSKGNAFAELGSRVLIFPPHQRRSDSGPITEDCEASLERGNR